MGLRVRAVNLWTRFFSASGTNSDPLGLAKMRLMADAIAAKLAQIVSSQAAGDAIKTHEGLFAHGRQPECPLVAAALVGYW